MNNNLLPHVTQEPIIAYDMLSAIGEKVKTEIANLNIEAIEATEENLSTIKKLRAALNGNFSELEERRKYIKSTVLKPYDDFEENYKKLIAGEFKAADILLKDKAVFVDDSILSKKIDGLKTYFSEKNTFEFIKFEDLGLKIIKSASDKSIQTEIDNKLKQIANDLAVIETLEHKDRVLAKYQLSKDLNGSISSVNIEVQRENAIKAAAEKAAEAKKEQIAEPTPEAIAEPAEEPLFIDVPNPVFVDPEPEDAKIYSSSFRVFGTKSQFKELKEFMNLKGIKYE